MLVVNDIISEVKQVVPIMELVKKTKRPLLLFSLNLMPEPMSTMIYNNRKGIVETCAVNIPWLGDVHIEMLKDVAVMTGASLVDNLGLNMEDVQLKHFGSA